MLPQVACDLRRRRFRSSKANNLDEYGKRLGTP
jgi:hypothetical protein